MDCIAAITSIHVQNLFILKNQISVPINTNLQFGSPAPDNHHSTSCLHEFDDSGELI